MPSLIRFLANPNMCRMKTIAIIPARYSSTRFPGKPLALLDGKPMIQWVWERVSVMPELSAAIVATDDARIISAVESFGGRAQMTSMHHKSGTDRCGEVLHALESQGEHYDVVINVQGDEPFTRSEQLQSLIHSFDDSDTQIATLKKPITDVEELISPNNVKVISNAAGQALYFSRQPIPYVRGTEVEHWLEKQHYFKHVGIYAFRSQVLKEVVELQQTPLEISESLEQLRWLENGYSIKVCETQVQNIGIDTPEDLAAAEAYLLQQK